MQTLPHKKANNSISNFSEEMQPFDILTSFSTEFFSKESDEINLEKTPLAGKTIQGKLDGQVLTKAIEKKKCNRLPC